MFGREQPLLRFVFLSSTGVKTTSCMATFVVMRGNRYAEAEVKVKVKVGRLQLLLHRISSSIWPIAQEENRGIGRVSADKPKLESRERRLRRAKQDQSH